jgi:hypothetical protein
MGSIPLASLSYLPSLAREKVWSATAERHIEADPLSVSRDQLKAWSALNTAASPEEALRAFPNSENLRFPDLAVVKMKLMGLRGLAVCGYVASLFSICLLAMLCLKRHSEMGLT